MAHHAFITQLIVLLPEHPAILSILPCLLASSCTCSLLLQLFSLLHHSTSLSLHTSLLHILTTALQLPVSPPELLLAEGSSVAVRTTDSQDAIALPPSGWCLSMEFALFSDADYSTVLTLTDDSGTPVEVVISRGYCTIMAQDRSIITPIPIRASDMSISHTALTPSNTLTLSQHAFCSFAVNSTSTPVALPPLSHPRITLFASSRPAILRSFALAASPAATPFFRITPLLLSHSTLLNAETPNVTPKASLLSVRTLLNKDSPRFPELLATINGQFLVSRNEPVHTAIQSLGGNSILFPLLLKTDLFAESENQAYLDHVLALLRVSMQQAPPNDWSLLAQCLARWDRQYLRAVLPPFVEAFSSVPESRELLDLFFRADLHEEIPAGIALPARTTLEWVCRCWYSGAVGAEVSKYEGYADWRVEDGRVWSAWLEEELRLGVESVKEEEVAMVLRVMLRESAEGRACDAFVEMLRCVAEKESGRESLLKGVAHLSEFADSAFGFLTAWVELKERHVPVDDFLAMCVEACETEGRWADLRVKPERVMGLLRRMRDLNVTSGCSLLSTSSLDASAFYAVVKHPDRLVTDAATRLLRYPNWFLPFPQLAPTLLTAVLRREVALHAAGALPFSLFASVATQFVLAEETAVDPRTLFLLLLPELRQQLAAEKDAARWPKYGQLLEFLFKELIVLLSADSCGDVSLASRWALVEPFLATLLLVPSAQIAPLLQALFVKCLPLVALLPAPAKQEEDLLFGWQAPAVAKEKVEDAIPEEVQKSVQAGLRALVGKLMEVCDVAHLDLLLTQLSETPAVEEETKKEVLTVLTRRMTSEAKLSLKRGLSGRGE